MVRSGMTRGRVIRRVRICRRARRRAILALVAVFGASAFHGSVTAPPARHEMGFVRATRSVVHVMFEIQLVDCIAAVSEPWRQPQQRRCICDRYHTVMGTSIIRTAFNLFPPASYRLFLVVQQRQSGALWLLSTAYRAPRSRDCVSAGCFCPRPVRPSDRVTAYNSTSMAICTLACRGLVTMIK
jgi:hypothetical protein